MIRKLVTYIILGVLFGITMVKSEAVSWYRIFEMFNFDSWHMYGIISTAIFCGVIGVQIIKRYENKNSVDGKSVYKDKEKLYVSRIIGGIIFGLGWALTGACPGPIYVLIGSGYLPLLLVLLGALAGTFVYGMLRPKLPH